jgi:hypothetical protein
MGKEAIQAAMEELAQRQLHHYNALCPHCGRTNRISQKALQRAAPRSQPAAAGTVETNPTKGN